MLEQMFDSWDNENGPKPDAFNIRRGLTRTPNYDRNSMAGNQRTCTFDGCDKPHYARGYCIGHYKQQWLGKPLTPLHVKMTLVERMALYTDKTGDCWTWTGTKNKKGYGEAWVGGKGRKAHRVAYELAYGPIPEGMQIDHTCHTRACVRPDHLRPVTNKQNCENRVGAQLGSKSGVRGVAWVAVSQKWRAQVHHNGQEFYLGQFATIKEAEAVARAKRVELFTHNDADRAVGIVRARLKGKR